MSEGPRQNYGRGLVGCGLVRLFCFGSLVVLGVVFRCLSLFLLCVNMGWVGMDV